MFNWLSGTAGYAWEYTIVCGERDVINTWSWGNHVNIVSTVSMYSIQVLHWSDSSGQTVRVAITDLDVFKQIMVKDFDNFSDCVVSVLRWLERSINKAAWLL